MARYTTILLVALVALMLCTPSLVTPSTAVSLVQAADTDTDNIAVDDGEQPVDDDAADYDDDDEDDMPEDDEDDDEEEEDDEEDGSEDTDAGDAAAEPAEPDKPAVIEPEGDEKAQHKGPQPAAAVFFDDFQNGLSQWTHSANAEYSGNFVVGQGSKPTIRGDRALIIPEKARKYGLSAPISGMADLSGKDVVIQYEVKVEEGVTCGGAYIKLPLVDFQPADLTGDTKYSVMFGPDKCGSTDKVHFIFQSKNGKTGEMVEHHLQTPPTIANSYDKKTHLYTLVVRADGTFEVLIDQEKKSHGSLMDKFVPPLQPAEKMDDPNDTKPADWVDEKKIADPDATKPDDWDEEAPKKIKDESATKPDGWMDDEPEQIADPAEKKPDEWDEEEDGAWEAPMIPNPKCEAAGCGEWKAPMIDNPEYKGKWKAPKIDNPKYIGEWSPKQIDNPDYYKVDNAQLLGMGGVAFEIWTMDQGVLFDNLYIGTNVEDAQKYANATFVVKQKAELKREEEEREKEDEEMKKKDAEAAASGGDKKARSYEGASKVVKTLGPIMDRVEDVVDKVEMALKPVEAWLHKRGLEPYLDRMIDMGIKKPMLVVVLMPLTITFLMLAILGGGKGDSDEDEEDAATTTTEQSSMATDGEGKKSDAETKDDEEEMEKETMEEKEEENDGGGIEAQGLRKRAVASAE